MAHLKERFGLTHVYMWHAMLGFWAGVAPAGHGAAGTDTDKYRAQARCWGSRVLCSSGACCATMRSGSLAWLSAMRSGSPTVLRLAQSTQLCLEAMPVQHMAVPPGNPVFGTGLGSAGGRAPPHRRHPGNRPVLRLDPRHAGRGAWGSQGVNKRGAAAGAHFRCPMASVEWRGIWWLGMAVARWQFPCGGAAWQLDRTCETHSACPAGLPLQVGLPSSPRRLHNDLHDYLRGEARWAVGERNKEYAHWCGFEKTGQGRAALASWHWPATMLGCRCLQPCPCSPCLAALPLKRACPPKGIRHDSGREPRQLDRQSRARALSLREQGREELPVLHVVHNGKLGSPCSCGDRAGSRDCVSSGVVFCHRQVNRKRVLQIVAQLLGASSAATWTPDVDAQR